MNVTAPLFKNRRQAGQLLARELKDFAGQPNVIVLALGVNGIPVAGEVAKELGCPLDVILCRRLEFDDGSAGAVSCEGVRVLNNEEICRAGLSQREVEALAARELEQLHRQEQIFRGKKGPPHIQRKKVLLVADFAVTGASLLAAARILFVEEPAELIVAVPVLSREAAELLKREVDGLVYLGLADDLSALGEYYEDFGDVSEEWGRTYLATAPEILLQPRSAA